MRAEIATPVHVLLMTWWLAGCAAGGGPQSVGPGPLSAESDGSDLIDRQYINPGELVEANGFSHAVRHGRVLYVSGELPLDQRGDLVGRGDRQAQLKAVFQNLRTVLTLARSSPADLLRLTVYLVDYTPADWDLMRQVAPEFFPTRNAPAVTLLGVQALAKEGAVVAVDATALVTGLLNPVAPPKGGIRRRG
jgi:enamine deaminase RidA (YjgF/YER057c/UK114 family)